MAIFPEQVITITVKSPTGITGQRTAGPIEPHFLHHHHHHHAATISHGEKSLLIYD